MDFNFLLCLLTFNFPRVECKQENKRKAREMGSDHITDQIEIAYLKPADDSVMFRRLDHGLYNRNIGVKDFYRHSA